MRPNPGKPPAVPSAEYHVPAGMERQVRRYELITPLFGGGVLPKEADPVTTVRGSEIRGHLRFWWRACRGGAFGDDLGKMKDAEDALWGAAAGEKGSQPLNKKVSISISDVIKGELIYPYKIITKDGRPKLRENGNSGVPSYAAFPLQPEQDQLTEHTQLAGVRKGIRFSLAIEYPADKQAKADVEAALWAWETFGGLGARTRRGFGTLRRIDGPGEDLPPAGAARTHLVRLLRKHCAPGIWPNGVPHITPDLKMRFVAANDAEDAWNFLIGELRKFRQARGADGYGPSQWPEPDSIRRMTTRRRGYTPSHKVHGKFPRAALGLPIVFKFRQQDERLGDPKLTTLQGDSPHSRMASPLILKPLACADGQVVCLAAILQGTGLPSGGVRLKGAAGDPAVETALDTGAIPPDTDHIPVLQGEPDVLVAFLKSLP